MLKNENKIESSLYIAIIQKESLPNNKLGNWLNNYLIRYQEKLNTLTVEESAALISYYSNNILKRT